MRKLIFSICLLFSLSTPIESDIPEEADANCLALNIFYESGSESTVGKIAVAYVTHNRSLNKHFPDNHCSVVYQKNQFVWVNKIEYRANHQITEDDKRWIQSVEIANTFMEYKDPTRGALFFHTKKAVPTWYAKLKPTVVIGNHIFFKFK